MARLVKQRCGHRARLAFSAEQAARAAGQAHAARALWNLLHELCLMCGHRRPPLSYLDAEIRWARENVDRLAGGKDYFGNRLKPGTDPNIGAYAGPGAG